MTLEEIARKGCGINCDDGQFCDFPRCLPPHLQQMRDKIIANGQGTKMNTAEIYMQVRKTLDATADSMSSGPTRHSLTCIDLLSAQVHALYTQALKEVDQAEVAEKLRVLCREQQV